MDKRETYVGAHLLVDSVTQEWIQEIVAHFHLHNGRLQEDGSLGTIIISLMQLEDILAVAYTRGTDQYTPDRFSSYRE